MKFIKLYKEHIDWEFDEEENEEEFDFEKIDFNNIIEIAGGYYIKQDDDHVFNNFNYDTKNYKIEKLPSHKNVYVYDADNKLFPNNYKNLVLDGWKEVSIKQLKKLNESIDWNDFDYDEEENNHNLNYDIGDMVTYKNRDIEFLYNGEWFKATERVDWIKKVDNIKHSDNFDYYPPKNYKGYMVHLFNSLDNLWIKSDDLKKIENK